MDTIIKYWSQITLLLTIFFGGTGYLLKSYFDWNIKKKEILFSKIKQTKIDELKAFYKCFVELETELINLEFATTHKIIDFEKEIGSRLPEKWQSFYLQLKYIRLFLSDDELVLIDELFSELTSIHLKLINYKSNRDNNNLDKELEADLVKIKDNIFPKKLPELLRKIEQNIRIDFRILNK